MRKRLPDTEQTAFGGLACLGGLQGGDFSAAILDDRCGGVLLGHIEQGDSPDDADRYACDSI